MSNGWLTMIFYGAVCLVLTLLTVAVETLRRRSWTYPRPLEYFDIFMIVSFWSMWPVTFPMSICVIAAVVLTRFLNRSSKKV